MRSWIVALCVVCLALAVGCRMKTSPEPVEDYDPALDGPPSILSAPENPELMADQARIAREAEALRKRLGVPAAATEPAG